MKIKNLNQRTSEWYNHRKKYINASEIGSITGNDKFRNLEQLVHDKIFGAPFISNKYTEHGNKTEPIARIFFEKITNLKFPDTILLMMNSICFLQVLMVITNKLTLYWKSNALLQKIIKFLQLGIHFFK